ncbi:hypothetical protein HDV06_001589 [Boothiomyces sp. JEL0866]|nr:hypothetical protein HDV06_001589 [Boothiomyces sp. JEL0866]
MDVFSNTALVVSSIISVICICYLLQPQYRTKYFYISIIIVHFINLTNIILRVKFPSDRPKYLICLISFGTDIVLYGLTYVYLNTLKLFSTLDERINLRIVNGGLYLLGLVALWIELNYYLYIYSGVELLYQFSEYVYCAFVVLGVLYYNVQALYLTILIYSNLKHTNKATDKIYRTSVGVILFIIALDCFNMAVYGYELINPTDYNLYYLGNLNIASTGIACALGSLVFLQFESLAQSQVRKKKPLVVPALEVTYVIEKNAQTEINLLSSS